MSQHPPRPTGASPPHPPGGDGHPQPDIRAASCDGRGIPTPERRAPPSLLSHLAARLSRATVVHRRSHAPGPAAAKVRRVLTQIAAACPLRRQRLADRGHLARAGLGPAAVAAAMQVHALVRVRRGVYAPGPLPIRARHLVSGGSPDLAYVAHVRAVLMSLGSTAMAGGRTAAALWGFDMYVEPRTVEVVAPSSRSTVAPAGVVLRRSRNATAVHVRVHGLEPLRVLSPAMTVVDCALTRPLREAVVIADSALRSRKVSLEELERVAVRDARHPRARRLRRVLDLVDPECGSVLESLLRVLFQQHGLRPESQVSLTDVRGRFLCRVDFLFREQRLVVECDGRKWHDPDDARELDRVRANELEREAWRLLRVTWNEVVHQPDHVAELVRDCLRPWPQAA